jgi:hypothetical protein
MLMLSVVEQRASQWSFSTSYDEQLAAISPVNLDEEVLGNRNIPCRFSLNASLENFNS